MDPAPELCLAPVADELPDALAAAEEDVTTADDELPIALPAALEAEVCIEPELVLVVTAEMADVPEEPGRIVTGPGPVGGEKMDVPVNGPGSGAAAGVR